MLFIWWLAYLISMFFPVQAIVPAGRKWEDVDDDE